MKRLVVLFTCMLLSACSANINSSHIHLATEACKDHRGISELYMPTLFAIMDADRLNAVFCVDGTRIRLVKD